MVAEFSEITDEQPLSHQCATAKCYFLYKCDFHTCHYILKNKKSLFFNKLLLQKSIHKILSEELKCSLHTFAVGTNKSLFQSQRIRKLFDFSSIGFSVSFRLTVNQKREMSCPHDISSGDKVLYCISENLRKCSCFS
jgi:hypothetical protein